MRKAPRRKRITRPGVFTMDDATYHADPVSAGSLSSTGARRILDSPARYRYELTHREEKPEFDEGHYVHAKVLGVGMGIEVLDFDSRRSNACKDAESAARAAGLVPVLAKDVAHLDAMAEAVLAHPTARAFLERDGQAEASAFAVDPETGMWLRARPDFLPVRGSGRTILVDLKTTITADPTEFGRRAAGLHYEQQDDLYRRVVQLARGDDDVAFVFVLVEKRPPHLVSVIELDVVAQRIGAERNRRAIDLYAACKASNTWPGYPTEVAQVSLPRWAEYAHDDLMEMTA